MSHRFMSNNISKFFNGVFVHYDNLYSYGYITIANLNLCINGMFAHHCLLMSLFMHVLIYRLLNMKICHPVCLKNIEAKIHNYVSI